MEEFFEDYGPDKSSDECYEALMDLKEEAIRASKALAAEGDDALATLLASLYIANQNQMTILWHHLARLEKKIDKLSIGIPKNRLK